MQLEDEELGLNSHATANAPSPLPTASTSRSPSPTPPDADTAADLARDLALFKVSSPADSAAEEEEDDTELSAEEEEVELVSQPKSKKGKRRKGPQSTFVSLAPPSDEEVEEDEFANLGIARKGRKGKAKGKAKSGSTSPAAMEGEEPVAGEVVEELPELEQKGKKSRRAKGKGKTPATSGTATPAAAEEGNEEEKGDAPEGIEEEEMSKKDRRRLREAAKMAAGPDELVSSGALSRFLLRLVTFLLLTLCPSHPLSLSLSRPLSLRHPSPGFNPASLLAAMQRLLDRLPIQEQALQAH